MAPLLARLGVGGGSGFGFGKKTASASFSATGGTIVSAGNGYTYHVFLSPGNFNVTHTTPVRNTVEYLVVAGGGAGGSRFAPTPSFGGGGGGGAGGVRTGTLPVSVSPGSYSVTVGSGGTRNPSSPVAASNSIFESITSARGGVGGDSASPGSPGPSLDGGSGGGGSGTGPSVSGGAGNVPPVSPSQGNPGANGQYLSSSGGGGGAGGSGSTTSGGPGRSVPEYAYPLILPAIPAPLQPTFGPSVGPTGIYGIGGNGQPYPSSANTSNGITNTGGGGDAAANGGPGIVIIRYQI